MKRITAILAPFIIFIAFPLAALDVPRLKGHVNDYAGMLKPETVSALEKQLSEFEKKDSTQIAVLTVPSLKGEALEQYSMKVAEKWKIGRKGKDNGVILLIAKEERKIRIEVGYGLEGRLTDLKAGRIIDRGIRPYFMSKDFDGGIKFGLGLIIGVVRGEFTGGILEEEPEPQRNTGMIIGIAVAGGCVGFIVILLVVINWQVNRDIRRGRSYSSSSSGGSDSGSSSSSESGSSSSDSSSSGSSSSSSGGSGSYSGGGGSFGGGGASGSW